MGNFIFHKCDIDGLYIVEPKVYGDARGYNMETYQYEVFQAAGLDMVFVQDNQSLSRKGVLRGLHFQKEHPQGKLVRVLSGSVYDVAVDLRKDSPTYGNYQGVVLSDENMKMFYVPEGFAHGFLVLSDQAVFSYKLTDYYHPEDESGILWNDPDIGVEWPLDNEVQPLLSEKDEKLPTLKESRFSFDR